MPNKTESMGNEIKSQIATLLLKGAENGSVTEDDVQGMLKDISVSESSSTPSMAFSVNRVSALCPQMTTTL